MKKILAGVLAAATMLTMSLSASAATTKAVTKPGEVTYDVAVTAPKIVLNVVMPAKMAASLNPYGADFKIDAETTPTTSKNKIVSTAYEVQNLTQDYGVYLDATAITTITTTDKTKWTVSGAKVTEGVKGAQMALIVDKDKATIKTAIDGTTALTSKAFDDTDGKLVMDSTVAADKTKGLVAGQTNQKKVAYIPASADGTTAQKIYMGFAGYLTASKDEGKATEALVEWKEDDAINVNLVLKVVAGPKAFPTP